MAHGRLAFSWPACTGCLPLSESIEISSLQQFLGEKCPRLSRTTSSYLLIVLCTLVHFGAVVAAAPSPLSTPRSAAGQAQLRLGKPLCIALGQAPTLSGTQEE